MKTLFIDEFDSPIGKIIVGVSHHGVERVIIAAAQDKSSILSGYTVKQDPSACHAVITQLKEYFAGHRNSFTVPLASEGSPFFTKVWHAVQEIPYGQTMSYSDIAVAVGHPRAAQAVGMACRHNPIPLFIPCHRVIGKQGQLSGYLGKNNDIKKFLLTIEKNSFARRP